MKNTILIVAIAVMLIDPVVAPAHNLRFDTLKRGQREITVLAGYGENHRIPCYMKDRFAFDVAKLRYGWFTSPRSVVSAELSLDKRRGQDSYSAFTTAATYRWLVLIRGCTALSFDASFGVTRFDRKIATQATKTNLTEQLGFTLEHAVGPSSAVAIEYKFSHTSNAGIKLPNLGVNASMIGIGYSWYH